MRIDQIPPRYTERSYRAASGNSTIEKGNLMNKKTTIILATLLIFGIAILVIYSLSAPNQITAADGRNYNHIGKYNTIK